MIKVFYGEDRVRAQAEMTRWFGAEQYEVVEGADLTVNDLPSLFMGGTLFGGERKILVRDFLSNKAVAEELVKYVETPHKVVLLETKLDKRTAAYKELAKLAGGAKTRKGDAQVEFREFKLVQPDFGKVFDVFRAAKRDGKHAVAMLAEIQATEDPKRFVGLMASQALKDFAARPGAKEKRVLVELSKLDVDLSVSALAPWVLVQGFLLRLAEI